MTTAAPPHTEIIPLESQRTAAAVLARAIRDRHTFMALTGACDVGKTVVLDAALAGVADEAIRLILVGNPRAGPFTLSSVLQQIAQYAPPPSPDADEDDVERIHAMLEAADQKRFVIVVEDAETLQPKALTFLQFLPELSGLTTGGLQIVLLGSPDLWRLIEGESFGRMREQLAVRVVVEPLSDAEARHFAAWRCRERLERFGPHAADAAMVEALVRHGRGLPARIDLLIDQVALLAPSHGGATAALVAEAAEMLTDGTAEPVAVTPAVIRPEAAAPGPRPRMAPPAASAVRPRLRPALLAGLIVTAALVGGLSFGRLGVPWIPWATKIGMIARRASASALAFMVVHEEPAVSPALSTAPQPAVASLGPSPPAPVVHEPPAFSPVPAPGVAPPPAVAALGPSPPAPVAPEPPAVAPSAAPPQPAITTLGANPPAPVAPNAPAASLPPTPGAAPQAAVATLGPNLPPAPVAPGASAATGAALARMRADFDAFLARAGTDTALLTRAQKRALFEQYLAWRTRQHAATPIADPTSAAP